MSLSDLTRWLLADWTHAVAALGVLALGYALAWAAIRASYERVVGRPMPRTRLVLVLDILADLAVNVPGALNRLLRSTGRDPLFLPSPAPTEAERYEVERRALMADPDRAPLPRGPSRAPAGRSGDAGRATDGALVVLAAVGLVAVAACPRVTRDPTVPAPPAGCVQGETICHEGAPWRCGPGGVWSQADRRCDRIGGVCCLTPSAVAPRSVHACTTHDRCEAPDAHP